jgi:hypothetical protein
MSGVPLRMEIIPMIIGLPMPLYLNTDNKIPRIVPMKTPPKVSCNVKRTPDPMYKKLEITLFIG